MLETIDLSSRVPKEEYKARVAILRERLYVLQKQCWDKRIPAIVVFEGWSASGKGTTINALTEWLEPRVVKIHAIKPARTLELHMPWLWRFWLKVPNYGEMAIFHQSWYRRVLVERVQKMVPKKEWKQAHVDIVDFERTLAADGYLIVKFFLQVEKKEQAARLKRLLQDPLERMLLDAEDHDQNRLYKEYEVAVEEMLARTSTEYAPWTLVPATDKYWTRIQVFETLIRKLEAAAGRRG